MKKFRVRFINEGSLMQPAIVSGNTTQEEMNKDPETEQMEQDQENSVVANSAPTLTPQQVADMSDGEVLSNFYLNPTSDLPEDAYQALQTRANDFANKVRVGNVTPTEMKKTSNAIAANNAKIQNPIGESADWMVSHIENVLLGKKGKKGRLGDLVWNDKDLYEETDEEKNGKTHYWNEWVGSFDRPSKTIYLNPDASTLIWNQIITAGRNLKWNLKKTQNRKPRVDMGFEGDEDPLFTEAYTSGRKDSFDELYYGGGESDWGIEDEDSTHSDSYIPTQTSEEFMTTKRGQQAKMLFDLKDEVADRIEELTDGKIKYATVYDFVEKYIDKAHEKYNNKELEKYSKVSRGKVDFFAKVILMKYKRNKNFTKLFSNE